jgi:hypothetical protein
MHKLSRRLDVRTEWSLVVVLQTMTPSALNGLTSRRTKAIVGHLREVAQTPSLPLELRATCIYLSKSWQTIDSAHPSLLRK